MSLKAGIVGLPNVGKSSLFNAITKQKVLSANYPFATIEPNKGIVLVPDERLEVLKKIYNSKEVYPTYFEFVDIAGLVKGASRGEGLGNKFLSHIREVDAVVNVVRCFEDEKITHVTGEVNPLNDAEIINYELILADLELINNRIEKIGNKAYLSSDKTTKEELRILNMCKGGLEKNIPLRKINFSKEELNTIKHYNFITLKPMIYVANISEEEINKKSKSLDELKEYASRNNDSLLIFSIRLLEEINSYKDEEQKLFLNEIGIKENALEVLIKTSYEILGLKTFFTCGEKETRAWTFRGGMNAQECAGEIHSDIEKGFIRAEVISYEDILMHSSALGAKEAGRLRVEGKKYLIQDGDICYFRFNV